MNCGEHNAMHNRVAYVMGWLGFYYGHTGGNCSAWILDLPNGDQVYVTEEDPIAPESFDDFVIVGAYPMDGDERSDMPVFRWEGKLRDYLDMLFVARGMWPGVSTDPQDVFEAKMQAAIDADRKMREGIKTSEVNVALEPFGFEFSEVGGGFAYIRSRTDGEAWITTYGDNDLPQSLDDQVMVGAYPVLPDNYLADEAVFSWIGTLRDFVGMLQGGPCVPSEES